MTTLTTSKMASTSSCNKTSNIRLFNAIFPGDGGGGDSFKLTDLEISEANQKIINYGGLMKLVSSILKLIKEKEYFNDLQYFILQYLRNQDENLYSGEQGERVGLCLTTYLAMLIYLLPRRLKLKINGHAVVERSKHLGLIGPGLSGCTRFLEYILGKSTLLQRHAFYHDLSGHLYNEFGIGTGYSYAIRYMSLPRFFMTCCLVGHVSGLVYFLFNPSSS